MNIAMADDINPKMFLKWVPISHTESKNGFHIVVYYNGTDENKKIKAAVLYNVPLGVSENNYQFGVTAFDTLSDLFEIKHYLYDHSTTKYNEVEELSEELILLELMKAVEREKLKNQNKEEKKPPKVIYKDNLAGVIQR